MRYCNKWKIEWRKQNWYYLVETSKWRWTRFKAEDIIIDKKYAIKITNKENGREKEGI